MRFSFGSLITVALLCVGATVSSAQDALSGLPRYDRYSRLARDRNSSIVRGSATITWSSDGKSFYYSHEGKNYKYDLRRHRSQATTEKFPTEPDSGDHRRLSGQPERGRQFSTVASPDQKMVAISRDRNVVISNQDDKVEAKITTDGSVASRIKYGVASWVYGEELEVKNAMWWSPDSKKLAYYRFDESKVKDYYVTLSQSAIQDTLDTEAYPKAGAVNPSVELYIYDLGSKQSTKVDVAFGSPELAEYIYDVHWASNGKLLFFSRTNRKQNIMQFCAYDSATGKSRTIVEEKQPQSWAENHPEIHFLEDGKSFIFASERSGFKNYYLYDLNGKLINQLTNNLFDTIEIARVDEKSRLFYYTSAQAEPANPYYRQFHRCSLDGKTDDTLTSPELDHTVDISADGKWLVDVAEAPDHPAESRLLDQKGKVLDTFLKSDLTKYNALGIKKPEIFQFKATDQKTDLYGTIQFPTDFDPTRKYPVLLTVYGGPESEGIPVRFGTPMPVTDFGFLVVNIAGRGTMSRGKAFRDAVYKHLGEVEIDDQNAGVESLGSRPYVDHTRVGVFGTSYGGYATCMLMLRHPETFHVGCASSSVTDWRNYDTIYTERYMGLPDESDNKAGYEDSSAMKYASKLRGSLMLYFGSADNNVHDSNTYQLTKALEAEGKFYDMTVGTDRGHSQMNAARMWAYFVTHLILASPAGTPAP